MPDFENYSLTSFWPAILQKTNKLSIPINEPEIFISSAPGKKG